MSTVEDNFSSPENLSVLLKIFQFLWAISVEAKF